MPGLKAEVDDVEDFEPRYCIVCRKQIPWDVSERQDACAECLAGLDTLARGAAAEAMPPPPGEMPPCPNCGGRNVAREWSIDWLLRAVDGVTAVVHLALSFAALEHGRTVDSGADVGPARTMRYHCRQCGERWKPRR